MRGTIKRLVTLVTVSLLAFVVACAPLPGEITPAPTPTPTPTPTVEWGIIEVRVTDPGVAGVDSAWVTAANIEIHPVGGNWTEIISSPPPFDLVYLADSENESVLGHADVLAGNFTGIRMDVTSVNGTITGGGEYTADVPSGKLRIARPFKVGRGLKTILTLDFDLTKCLIETGKGTYLFKPVVRLKVEQHSSPPETLGGPEKPGEPKKPGKPEGQEAEGDVTPPVISISGVTNDKQYTAPVTPTFEVSDETDPEPTVTATLNDDTFVSRTEVSEVGEYELVVTAVDASGNEAESSVNFEIVEAGDTTAPVIDVSGVSNGEQYTEPVTPIVDVSDETDPNPTVTITLNGVEFASETEISEAGEYELVVKAIDASGNEAEVTIEFEIVQGG